MGAIGILLLGAMVSVAVVWVVSDDGAKSARSRLRALAEPSAQDRDRELARWNLGWHERPKRIPFAEHANGTCYVLGHGIDDAWVRSLMDSDDRIRRWNGLRPRGFALSRRLD